MKRILIAIHALSFDGAEKVAALWANYLARNGFQVAFLVRYRLKEEQKLDETVKVFSIADAPDAYGSVSAFHRLRKVRKIAKTFAPDLTISFLPKMQLLVMLATWGMKCKRFETVRNNPWQDKDVGKKRFLWNLCFLRSHRILLQTEEQGEYFSGRLQKKCVVIRNPILQAAETKQYAAGFPQKFIALGRISRQKNYPVMIEAFAEAAKKIEGCTLDIFGTGDPSYIEQMQNMIDAAGLHEKVVLRGRTDKVLDELLRHDGFFMSSDYEGMPNALAEAMAAGLVCLSTDCKTGPRDMIDSGENGFLVATGDVQSFADGILKIAEMNERQCMAMGQAAREKIGNICSEETTLLRLKELIESVL